MLLKFIGVGSAFAPRELYQTNVVIGPDDKWKRLLIDCGSDARFALEDAGIPLDNIDGVYVSHLHADHIGGLEWLALNTFFSPKDWKPTLFADRALMRELWYHSLCGGLETIQGQLATLTTFFDCQPISPNEGFLWEGIAFQPVQTVHVVSGFKIQYSYGLMIDVCPGMSEDKRLDIPVTRIFFTSDTQFCPHQIVTFYTKADVIFQDCETSKFKSNVHAHIDDLRTLPPEIKSKMWLMHYQADGKLCDQGAKNAGFLGLVQKGQEFQFPVRGEASATSR
jgi:ribonuclease BN (tRNA processing enzyme)